MPEDQVESSLYGYEDISAERLEVLRGKDVIDACLFSGDFASGLKTFVERFEAAIDGRTEDFYELGNAMFALGFHVGCGHSFAERYSRCCSRV